MAPRAFAPATVPRHDDPRPDEPFARLKAAVEFGEAGPIERDIRALWIEAGDEKLDRIMNHGIGAMNARQFRARKLQRHHAEGTVPTAERTVNPTGASRRA